MPIDITDVNEFTDPITAPAGSDPANAASVVAPVQKLSNRTRFLRTYCTDFGIQLPAALQTTVFLHAFSFRPAVDAQWSRFNDEAVRSETDGAIIYADLTPRLFLGASIVRVRVLVDPGAARAGTDRIHAFLNSHSWGASFGAPAIVSNNEGDEYDDASGGLQWITLDFAVSPLAVALKQAWTLMLVAGNDAGTNKDKVYGAAIERVGSTIRND